MARFRFTMNFLVVVVIGLVSVSLIQATPNHRLNRRENTIKFLKELQARKAQDKPMYLSKPETADERKQSADFAAFNFDELRDDELPFETPLNEWILNQVEDADADSFERLPGSLVKTPLGNITLQCYNDIVKTTEDVAKGEAYALAVAASFGSYDYLFERYYLTGQTKVLGDFDLCSTVRKDYKHYKAPFDAKYCLQNMAEIKVGTCWSDSCTDADLYTVVFTYLGIIYGLLMNPWVICEVKEPWFPGAIATISVIAVFIFIVGAATFYHLTFHHFVKRKLKKAKETERNRPTNKHNNAAYAQHVDEDQSNGSAHAETKMDDDMKTKIATAGNTHDYGTVPFPEEQSNDTYEDVKKGDFLVHQEDQVEEVVKDKSTSSLAFIDRLILSSSAVRNSFKFFDTTVKSPDTLCLNGLRVLSMWWIILGHCASFLLDQRLDNVWRGFEQLDSLTHRAVTESPFGVDTFFFLSGLLVAYLTLKQMAKRNGSFNWGLFYFHRWWRITPMYMIVLAVWATLFLQWGQGPGHNDTAGYINGVCHDLWWTHFVYINNLYPFPGDVNVGTCMGWAWYLANDMQFFIISPFILLIMYKSWKWGVGTILGMCLISFASTIYLTIYWGLGIGGALGVHNNRTLEDERFGGDYIYGKPYVRIPAYLIGLLFGFMLYSLKGRKITMRWWQVIGGWAIAIFTGLAVVYGAAWTDASTPQYVVVLYNTFTRPAFALAVGWVAFACIMGYGGLVNRFLSWSVWIPLGRLTFGAYLVHPMIILWYLSTMKTMWHLSYTTVSYFYAASLVYSYAVAFVFAIFIEGPTGGLEEVILGKWRRGRVTQPTKATK